MKEKMGIVLFCIGMMTADSERLIVPILLIGMGMWLAKELMKGSED